MFQPDPQSTTTATDPGGFEPVEQIDGAWDSGILLITDHASNALPQHYGTLGLAPEELERHIGYDIGSARLTRALAARLEAPAIMSTFSRLLIDPNRGDDDPTLVMRLSDGAIIPGNAHHDADERAHRIATYYQPYHDAINAGISRSVDAGKVPMILSVHSFTPVWRGVARPWHAGILWDNDPRLAVPLIDGLRSDDDIMVGDNEPYRGYLKNDTLYFHGTIRGIAHALIEVRQDLIDHEAGIEAWADRIAPIMAMINRDPQTHAFHEFGSRTDLDPGTEDSRK